MKKFFDWVQKKYKDLMQGRYGTDRLNLALLFAGLICCMISLLFSWIFVVNVIFTVLSFVFLILAILRALSRNTYKRYQENRKFLMIFEKLKDREHRYFDCPRCRQQVRVPRGKGKISISCPKCKEKFIKKT